MRVIAIAVAGAALLLWSALAGAEAGPREGQIFGSLLGGYYDGPKDELDIRKGDTNIGGALGWAPSDRWSVEAMYFDFDPGVDVNTVHADGDMEYWSLNILANLGRPESWQPYFVLGGGKADYEYDDLQDGKHDQIFTAGLGFFSNLTERLAFRADVRGAYHHNAEKVTPMATAGITLLLGGSPRVPPDTDGDGVPDASDACPGTPAGTPVDATGCPRDSDGDGVADGEDQCPNTPSGADVDNRGCPLDSDGDGVADHDDDCPNTPRGTRVDTRGCEVRLEQPVSFNLTVEFGFDEQEIQGVGFQEMLEVLKFLREHPSTTAEIEGHTDSVGPDAYNQTLSEQRAQAVVDALVNSGISRDRLMARGYGESRPVASNDTDEGRAQNRRVAVTVSGTE